MNSAATPVIDYRAITECGRILTHSSTSPMSAMYEIKRDRYMTVVEIEPFALWEARQPDNHEMLELHSEYETGDAA